MKNFFILSSSIDSHMESHNIHQIAPLENGDGPNFIRSIVKNPLTIFSCMDFPGDNSRCKYLKAVTDVFSSR